MIEFSGAIKGDIPCNWKQNVQTQPSDIMNGAIKIRWPIFMNN